jgi:hypothetical protein
MSDDYCGCGHDRGAHDRGGKGKCQVRVGRESIPGKPESRALCACDRGAEAQQPRLCEESKDGHLVTVKLWPPKMRYGASKRAPSVSGVCELCEAHVVVYDPPQGGLRVKLPDGRVVTADAVVGAKKAS